MHFELTKLKLLLSLTRTTTDLYIKVLNTPPKIISISIQTGKQVRSFSIATRHPESKMALNNANLNHFLHSSQSTPVARHWQAQGATTFSIKDFILPVFVLNDDSACAPCPSFPGVNLMGVQVLLDYLRPLVNEYKLASLLFFPSLVGDKTIEDAFDSSKNPLLRVASVLKKEFPDLILIADVCLCTFSETGKNFVCE